MPVTMILKKNRQYKRHDLAIEIFKHFLQIILVVIIRSKNLNDYFQTFYHFWKAQIINVIGGLSQISLDNILKEKNEFRDQICISRIEYLTY